jgi:protein kinase A
MEISTKKDDKEKIKLSDFEILETLGTGSFGRVRLGRHKKSKKIYAIKMLKKCEIIRLKQVDHIHSEYQILNKLNHPFIVEFKGALTTDPKYLYFILEFVQGGELFTILRTAGSFTEEQSKFYAAHIVTIFEYLHGKNMVYRDLKPENVLLNSNGYIKLTDFGFAKVVDGKTYTLCGTPEYLAPEIILNKGHGKAVDWWTLGILIYEMLVGIDPFNDDDPMMVYQKIIKGKIKFPKNVEKDAKSIIKHLLDADVTKRYGCLKEGVKDIIDHRWFKGFDWKSLLFMTLEAPNVPKITSSLDTKNFSTYPDSDSEIIPIKADKDPFITWS